MAVEPESLRTGCKGNIIARLGRFSPLPHVRIHRAWRVLAVIFLALFFLGGARNTFAVFYKPIAEDQGWSRGALAGAVTLSQFVLGIAFVAAGLAVDRLGPRKVVPLFALLQLGGNLIVARATHLWHIYAGFGIVMAMASGIGAGPFLAIAARWFQQHRGLAIAIGTSASQAGVVVFSPINSLLIDSIGWRWTFALLGGLSSAMLLAASRLLYRRPEEVGLLPYGARPIVEVSGSGAPAPPVAAPSRSPAAGVLRRPDLWLVILVYIGANLATGVVLFHLVNYASDRNLSAVAAAGTLAVLSAVSVGGRLVIGVLGDRVRLAALLSLSIASIAIPTGLLPLFSGVSGIYIAAAVFGIGLGGIVVLQTLIPRAMFGERSLGSMLGIVLLAANIGAGSGALLGGVIFDSTGSYTVAFLAAASLAGLAGLAALRTRG